MKGIILAGGRGSRLYPITKAINKHLFPIYNKPMIYYPLCTLISLKIEDILIIVSNDQLEIFQKLLEDGRDFGVSISYEIQNEANGIPEAFIIGERFIDNDNVTLILGDNFFYGESFYSIVGGVTSPSLFLYKVDDARRFGVCEIENGKILNIEEKPCYPKSNYAVTGLYIYDNDVSYYSRCLRRGIRNELEITDLNNIYVKEGKMGYRILGEDITWFDMGTFESFYLSGKFVRDLYVGRGIDIGNLDYMTKKGD